jgi:hypothetical protein
MDAVNANPGEEARDGPRREPATRPGPRVWGGGTQSAGAIHPVWGCRGERAPRTENRGRAPLEVTPARRRAPPRERGKVKHHDDRGCVRRRIRGPDGRGLRSAPRARGRQRRGHQPLAAARCARTLDWPSAASSNRATGVSAPSSLSASSSASRPSGSPDRPWGYATARPSSARQPAHQGTVHSKSTSTDSSDVQMRKDFSRREGPGSHTIAA